jgi:prepilin-type N-terminal cleavage/methylation domain-containing protein
MENNFQKNKKRIGGYTLIEFLMAMAVFSLIMGSAVQIFSSTIKSQRRSFAVQRILDQTSFSFDYLSRAVRMAKTGTIQLTRVGQGIIFQTQTGASQEIFFNGQQLQVTENGNTENLTSSDVQIDSFRINISGETIGDYIQPKVTVVLSASTTGNKVEEITNIKVQTTVSQRNLE